MLWYATLSLAAFIGFMIDGAPLDRLDADSGPTTASVTRSDAPPGASRPVPGGSNVPSPFPDGLLGRTRPDGAGGTSDSSDETPKPAPADAAAPWTPRSEPLAITVPEQGPGTFTAVPTDDEGGASGPYPRTSYRIEVEDRLPLSKNVFARIVDATLADERGWSSGNQYTLVRTSGSADIRIVLATPATTDLLCAPLETNGRVSCRNGSDVVINAWRWVHGAPAYRDDLANYRRYVINHEVGHALGRSHQPCPRVGATAPVMLQQTLGLEGCKKNPWPINADLTSD